MLKNQYEMIINGGNLGWCVPYFGTFRGKEIAFTEDEGGISGAIIDGKEFVATRILGRTEMDDELAEIDKIWRESRFDGELSNCREGECKECLFFEHCQAWENELQTWDVHSDGDGSMWVTIYTIDGKEHYIEVNESNYEAAKAKIIVETAALGVDEEELEFIRE